MLDQISSTLGAITGAALAAGVIARLAAAAVGGLDLKPARLLQVAAVFAGGGIAVGVAAIALKGAAKLVDDDQIAAAKAASVQSAPPSLHSDAEARDD